MLLRINNYNKNKIMRILYGEYKIGDCTTQEA